jgi:hypothetical protein
MAIMGIDVVIRPPDKSKVRVWRLDEDQATLERCCTFRGARTALRQQQARARERGPIRAALLRQWLLLTCN